MGLEHDEPTGNTDGIDVDALMQSIEGGSKDIPMTHTAPVEGARPETKEEAPASPQYPKEVELTWNGKVMKAPWDNVIQWAQQGRDYSQKMAEFNQARTQWEQERESYNPYKTIDEYAKQNPQWWNHVKSQYEAQLSNPEATTTGQNTNPELEALKNELGELKKFKLDLESEKLAKQREAEDTQLSKEIESIRKDFKDLDWDSVDANGQTLEQRVINHAIASDIKSFRAAFRDYNHDQLLKRAEEKAKESVVKERQKQTKLGLLGKTQAPVNGIKSAENVKTKTYDDLFREALNEAGIA